MKIIKIKFDGFMEENNINNINDLIEIDDNIKELYFWNYQNLIIKCYGIFDLEHIIYNKHILPPGGKSNIDIESSEIKLNCDIYICASYTKNILVDYTIGQYAELVYILNEHCDLTSEEEIEEEIIDKEIINNDKIDKILNNTISKDNTNDVLEYDINNY